MAFLTTEAKKDFERLRKKMKQRRLTGEEQDKLKEYIQLQHLQDEQDGWRNLFADMERLERNKR